MRRKAGFMILLILCLTGCGVEPEKRDYPLAVGVDLCENDYRVGYAMGNLPAMTGQGKEGEEGETGVRSYSGPTLRRIREKYEQENPCYLDTGHVQVILFGEKLLKNRDRFGQVLSEMETNRILGCSCSVFSSPNPEKVLEGKGAKDSSVGEYLIGICKNRPEERKKETVTLQDVYAFWHERGEIPGLPQALVGENDEIIVEERKES